MGFDPLHRIPLVTVVICLLFGAAWHFHVTSEETAPTTATSTTTTTSTTVTRPRSSESSPEAPPSSTTETRGAGEEASPPQGTKLSRRRPCMSLLEPFDEKYKNFGNIAPHKIHKIQNVTQKLAVACPRVLEGVTRKVLIDLGANQYRTSIAPFLSWYPDGKSFIVHAFEPLDFRKSYSECAKGTCTYHRAVLGPKDGFLSFRSQSKWQADNYNAVVHTTKDKAPRDAIFTVPMHDVATWIKNNLHPENDFVVMKMDTEGAEWSIMDRMKEAEVWKYIDEFLFECHHEKMSDRYIPKKYQDCVNAMDRLRKEEAVAAHIWYI